MHRRWVSLVVVLAATALGGTASAGGDELHGHRFRARAPEGFEVETSENQSAGSVLTLRRSTPDHGDLVLTFASHQQDDASVARMEQELARTADAATAQLDFPGTQARTVPARVSGADDAYEMVVQGQTGSRRVLSARQSALLVSVTLDAEPGAEEAAEEAWRVATSSLRIEDSGGAAGTVLLWVLGAMAGLAVLVTIVKRAGRVPPSHPRYTPPPEQAADATPAFAAAPFVPPPGRPATARKPRGAGFSRADDGMPTFTYEMKAPAADDEELLALLRPTNDAPPRRPSTPAKPSRPTNLAPRAPIVRNVKPG